MDKNMLQGLDNLTPEEQARVNNIFEQLQVRDTMRLYNSVVERCFTDCVDSFTRKTLQKQEETCVMRCAEKFFKHSLRVGMRYAESNVMGPTTDNGN